MNANEAVGPEVHESQLEFARLKKQVAVLTQERDAARQNFMHARDERDALWLQVKELGAQLIDTQQANAKLIERLQRSAA